MYFIYITMIFIYNNQQTFHINIIGFFIIPFPINFLFTWNI